MTQTNAGSSVKTEHAKRGGKAITVQLFAGLRSPTGRLQCQRSRRAVLIVCEGEDTSAKDGNEQEGMSGVNPPGCKVATFKRPYKSE